MSANTTDHAVFHSRNSCQYALETILENGAIIKHININSIDIKIYRYF